MNKDFEVFQWKIFSALTPNVPLRNNLSAVMAPALRKFNKYNSSDVALHIFSNPEVHEWHVMVVDASANEDVALEEELLRRHNPDNSLIPNSGLPDYCRYSIKDYKNLQKILQVVGKEQIYRLDSELLTWLASFASQQGDQFCHPIPQKGDHIIIIQVGSNKFPRLGHILLWSPSDKLKEIFNNPRRREGRAAFCKGMESLIVRIFTNFYRMEPHTYLPSYYQIQDKYVTLLCAEIRDFDLIASIIRQRSDFSDDTKNNSLRSLVNGFNEIGAKIIEKYHGRVDQIWGSGMVAIFGEYLDTPDASPRPGCKRAVSAAADIVHEFRGFVQTWLNDDFHIAHYREEQNAFVNIIPAVAIDYSKVLFEYVGSPKHKVYMAIGERVNFVKQLVGISGRIDIDERYLNKSNNSNSQRAISGEINWLPDYEGDPIILSQSAHEWSKDLLIDVPGSPSQQVHIPILINMPGRPERFPIFTIKPENVSKTTVNHP